MINEGMPDLSERYPSATELRQWAQGKRAGAGISNAGKMPRFVVLAWDKAHPGRPYVASQNFHGTPGGYFNHDCRCDGCLTVGRAEGRRKYELGRDERDEALADSLLDEEATA